MKKILSVMLIILLATAGCTSFTGENCDVRGCRVYADDDNATVETAVRKLQADQYTYVGQELMNHKDLVNVYVDGDGFKYVQIPEISDQIAPCYVNGQPAKFFGLKK